MDRRKGNKSRLFLSAKRKKNHLQIKQKIHFAPCVNLSTFENEENFATPLTSTSKQNQEIFKGNRSSSSSETSLNDLDFIYNDDDDTKDGDEELENNTLSGRRIVDIKYLFSSISLIKHEHTGCTFSDLKFIAEQRKGFISKYVFECKMCKKIEKVYGENPNLKLNVNTAFVEGMLCSGNAYAQLNEICSTLNMPNMHHSTYTKIEQCLAPKIEESATDEMIVAGEEEKALAILNGEVDKDGCPLITVIADGSWAKRSYKSGFSSASGTACIVGLRTKKVLFLGVRNSYCCICARSQKLNLDVPEHRCFKNWRDSANAMEADIIAEGFAKSVQMHGLKYNKLVGDGDSSIMKKLLVNKPYGPNFVITKIECKNHLLRNFCNKIKALGKKTNNHKGFVPVQLRKKVEGNVLRLRKAIVGAVNYRKSQDINQSEKIKNLKKDIKNAANHVFGDHSNCDAYFCDPEKYKNEKKIVLDLQNSGLWSDIQNYSMSLVTNAESLLLDITNNAVEQFNNVIAKFIGGKRVNYTNRGSYQARCFGAVTSWNTDMGIHSKLSKKIQGCSPGQYTKKFIEKKRQSRQRTEKCRKRKISFTEAPSKKRNVTGPDDDYGRLELEPDMQPEIFEQKKSIFLSELNLSKAKAEELQRETIGQSDNELWVIERRKRITASNFGKVCKLRKKTSVAGLLKSLLYSQFTGTAATNYGKENEDEAIRQFSEETRLDVVKCGLFIDNKKCFLAASPDGLINDDSIVEVKCPYKLREYTPKEGIENKKIDYCTLDSNMMKLKRNHNYFYQIQGQLHITQRSFCYFILWTPKGLLYEKIEKDDEFWRDVEPKLEKFYNECLLPEIIDGRIPRNMPVRERME